MKKQLGTVLIIFTAALHSQAFTEKLETSNFNLHRSDVKIYDQVFDRISTKHFLLSKNIGQPSLPSKSYLFAARPENINLQLTFQNSKTIKGVRLAPAEPEKCRCIDDLNVTRRTFTFSESKYQIPQAQVTKTYLGQFRGTPITKVDIQIAVYDAKNLELTTYESAQISTEVPLFNVSKINIDAVGKNFLIVIPSGWESAITDFANYKNSLGYNMIIESISSPNNTKEALQQRIKTIYNSNNLVFAMIIGDEKTIPMFSLDTSSSSATPSDLPYFTMDGANDHIPDVFTSRIAAANANSVKDQLAKIMDQEQTNQKSNTNQDRMTRNIIGIASGEGYNPSDAEYITAVNNSLREKWVGQVTYLYERNQDSNAETLNGAFNNGAFWLTYIGHGSGYAWPSMYDYYSTTDIAAIDNSLKTKPVIIDVACQNGRLLVDHLGSQFMNPRQSRGGLLNGAAAYYGGSVNISWHPPAIMARGIAFEHMSKNFNFIGEALLAGQLYLANNWTNVEDIVDNMEWYHLQGDPSYSIHY